VYLIFSRNWKRVLFTVIRYVMYILYTQCIYYSIWAHAGYGVRLPTPSLCFAFKIKTPVEFCLEALLSITSLLHIWRPATAVYAATFFRPRRMSSSPTGSGCCYRACSLFCHRSKPALKHDHSRAALAPEMPSRVDTILNTYITCRIVHWNHTALGLKQSHFVSLKIHSFCSVAMAVASIECSERAHLICDSHFKEVLNSREIYKRLKSRMKRSRICPFWRYRYYSHFIGKRHKRVACVHVFWLLGNL